MALPHFPILGACKKIELKKGNYNKIEAIYRYTALPPPPMDFDFHDFGQNAFFILICL